MTIHHKYWFNVVFPSLFLTLIFKILHHMWYWFVLFNVSFIVCMYWWNKKYLYCKSSSVFGHGNVHFFVFGCFIVCREISEFNMCRMWNLSVYGFECLIIFLLYNWVLKVFYYHEELRYKFTCDIQGLCVCTFISKWRLVPLAGLSDLPNIIKCFYNLVF